ncbi:MAG: DMT family transporter [Oligoflexia bacterium]|nr:DMT family transporter [Oligoflexia bacterium]
MRGSQPSSFLVYGALISVQVLFGINYVVSKVVVDSFPPLVWASIRIIISSLIMLAAALLFRRGHHPTGGRKFFVPLIIFALLGTVINQASFLVGLHYTTSTNSAVLNTLIPVFTLLIVTLRGQEPLTWKRTVGFFLALGGVLVIRKVEDFSFSNTTMIGDLLTILNCLSYGFFLSYSKKFIEENDRVWTTTWLFIYGSVGLTAIAGPGYLTFQWPVMTPMLVASMLFAVIGGTLLTYFLNNWALAYARSSAVALFIYFQPIVTAALALVWFGQEITARTAVSSGLIFAGMLMALAQPKPKEAAQPVAVES